MCLEKSAEYKIVDPIIQSTVSPAELKRSQILAASLGRYLYQFLDGLLLSVFSLKT